MDVNSTNATPPYRSWSTAATNIQDAVDAAAAGDEVVVTNGICPSKLAAHRMRNEAAGQTLQPTALVHEA